MIKNNFTSNMDFNMVLGGTDESGRLLNNLAMKKLPLDTHIRGKWKIHEIIKTSPIRKKKSHLLLIKLYLLDTMRCKQHNIHKNTLLEGRIWNHPKTKPIPQKDDIIIVNDYKAQIKNFNQSTQLHIEYIHLQYIRCDATHQTPHTVSSTHVPSSECSDERTSNSNPIPTETNTNQQSFTANNLAKHNRDANTLQSHNGHQIHEAALITHTIQHLFAWTVHHFPLFKHISHEWPVWTYPPSTAPFMNGQNELLKLLIDGITRKDLMLTDPIELYGRHGDAILDEMWFIARKQTRELLHKERYGEVSVFTKLVLQRLNELIVKHNVSEIQYDECRLRAKCKAFPLRKDFEKLPSRIVYHILHSSLQINKRSDGVLKDERDAMKRICKLCFNSDVQLAYHLNVGLDVCDACGEQIMLSRLYWKLYEAMLNWDNGWKLLFSNDCDPKNKSVVGVLCAILFRDAYYRTQKQ
eukprot:264516_1